MQSENLRVAADFAQGTVFAPFCGVPTPPRAESELVLRIEQLEHEVLVVRRRTRLFAAALFGAMAAMYLMGAKEDATLRGEGLELVDAQGTVVLSAHARMGGATLVLHDGSGTPRLRLSSVEQGRMEFANHLGTPTLRFGGGNAANTARMAVIDPMGRRIVDLSSDAKGRGYVNVFDRRGMGKSLLPMPSHLFGTRYHDSPLE